MKGFLRYLAFLSVWMAAWTWFMQSDYAKWTFTLVYENVRAWHLIATMLALASFLLMASVFVGEAREALKGGA